MLRQLARLTRPLPTVDNALAVSVYLDEQGKLVAAKESGFEGVACVDDVARALRLLIQTWDETRKPWVRQWALGFLEFLLYMEQGDGTFANFVLDWDGEKNLTGPTSFPGINAWQARAFDAISQAHQWFADSRIEVTYRRARDAAIESENVPADIRAIHMSAILRQLTIGEEWHLQSVLADWAEELVECRAGAVLLNYKGEKLPPHLYMHIQEGVLAEAGRYLGRSDLVAIAVASAEAVFRDVIEREFDSDHVIAYDVYSATICLDRLAKVCRSQELADLAKQARQWFWGRNSAGLPVYDEIRGKVYDGIDFGEINQNSGAESNIVAGLCIPEAASHDALSHEKEILEILPLIIDVRDPAPAKVKAPH